MSTAELKSSYLYRQSAFDPYFYTAVSHVFSLAQTAETAKYRSIVRPFVTSL